MASSRGAIKWSPGILDHSRELTREFDRLYSQTVALGKQSVPLTDLLEFGAGVQRLHEKLADVYYQIATNNAAPPAPHRPTAIESRTQNGVAQHPHVASQYKSPYTTSLPPVSGLGNGYAVSGYVQQPALGQGSGDNGGGAHSQVPTLLRPGSVSAPMRGLPHQGAPTPMFHFRNGGSIKGWNHPQTTPQAAPAFGRPAPPEETSPAFAQFSENTKAILKRAGVNISAHPPIVNPSSTPGIRPSLDGLSPQTEQLINQIKAAPPLYRPPPPLASIMGNEHSNLGKSDSRPMQYRLADERLQSQAPGQSGNLSSVAEMLPGMDPHLRATMTKAMQAPTRPDGQTTIRPGLQSTTQPTAQSSTLPAVLPALSSDWEAAQSALSLQAPPAEVPFLPQAANQRQMRKSQEQTTAVPRPVQVEQHSEQLPMEQPVSQPQERLEQKTKSQVDAQSIEQPESLNLGAMTTAAKSRTISGGVQGLMRRLIEAGRRPSSSETIILDLGAGSGEKDQDNEDDEVNLPAVSRSEHESELRLAAQSNEQPESLTSDPPALSHSFSFSTVSSLTDQDDIPEPVSPPLSPAEDTHPPPIQEFQPDPEDNLPEEEVEQIVLKQPQEFPLNRENTLSEEEEQHVPEQISRRRSARQNLGLKRTYNIKILSGTSHHTRRSFLAKHTARVTREENNTPPKIAIRAVKAKPKPFTAVPDGSLSVAESRITSRTASHLGSHQSRSAVRKTTVAEPRISSPEASRPVSRNGKGAARKVIVPKSRKRKASPFTEEMGVRAGEGILKAFYAAQDSMNVKGTTRLERILIGMERVDQEKRDKEKQDKQDATHAQAKKLAQITPPESISGRSTRRPRAQKTFTLRDIFPSIERDDTESVLAPEARKRKRKSSPGPTTFGDRHSAAKKPIIELGSPEGPWSADQKRPGGRLAVKDVPPPANLKWNNRRKVAEKRETRRRASTTVSDALVTPVTPTTPASPTTGPTDQQITSRGRTVRASAKVKHNLELLGQGMRIGDA